jgi:hypothetical protein
LRDPSVVSKDKPPINSLLATERVPLFVPNRDCYSLPNRMTVRAWKRGTLNRTAIYTQSIMSNGFRPYPHRIRTVRPGLCVYPT